MTSEPSVVLLYHRIGSPIVRSIVRGQYVAPGLFRRQIGWVISRGYRAVTLAEMLSKQAFNGHIAITLDDGYSSARKSACPILAENEIPATIYAVAGLIGKTNEWDVRLGDREETLMTAQELRELSAAGFEIGSHGMTHARLTGLPDAELRIEVADSKKLLEDLIGARVTGFSYPYGDFDARIRDAVIEAGYVYAASTKKGVLEPSVDRFAVPRINVRWSNVPTLLMRKIGKAVKRDT